MLVVYDVNGKVLVTYSDDEQEPPVGVPSIICEKVEGYHVESVNVSETPHRAIYLEDDRNNNEILSRISNLEIAIAGLYGMEVI